MGGQLQGWRLAFAPGRPPALAGLPQVRHELGGLESPAAPARLKVVGQLGHVGPFGKDLRIDRQRADIREPVLFGLVKIGAEAVDGEVGQRVRRRQMMEQGHQIEHLGVVLGLVSGKTIEQVPLDGHAHRPGVAEQGYVLSSQHPLAHQPQDGAREGLDPRLDDLDSRLVHALDLSKGQVGLLLVEHMSFGKLGGHPRDQAPVILVGHDVVGHAHIRSRIALEHGR